MTARRRSSGFSLIEVLIVVALLSVVTGMGFRLTRSAARLHRQQSASVLAFQQGRRALARIARELRGVMLLSGDERFTFTATGGQAKCALPAAPGVPESMDREVTVQNDRLRFTTAIAVRHAGGPGLGTVAYALQIKNNGNILGLQRTASALAAEESTESQMLGTKVVELGFRFLTEPGEKGRWVDRWPADDKSPPLPAAVRVTVGVIRPTDMGKDIYRYTGAVYLPARVVTDK